MHHVREVQQWLRGEGLDGIIVPSTDEFLSEFSPPANRRLRWVTGFRGSTGLAIVLQDAAALFLDGRYLHQAAAEIDTTAIEVQPAVLSNREAWLKLLLPREARLAFDPWLHSVVDGGQWEILASRLGIELRSLPENPVDRLWGNTRPALYTPRVVDYPEEYAGETRERKCAALTEYVRGRGLHALLVADPEDVSWLLNVRATPESIKVEVGDWHIVPACASRAMLTADGSVLWFADVERVSADLLACISEVVTLLPVEALASVLSNAARMGAVAADVRRTPFALSNIIESIGRVVPDDTVSRRRWQKHPVEIEAARRVHVIDAAAVVRFASWLTRTVPSQRVSEMDAARKLHELRAQHEGYVAPSMPLMSAAGVSGAQPHYVPTATDCRYLNDHPIFWMDSGGQYLGGSTDNTITLALGTPHSKHLLAHTLVLQGFIALATSCFPAGTPAFRLDPIARQALWREGMDYDHGTGHGVGNYLNIHEGPLLTREPSAITDVPLEPGMIVTNEPGYYAAGDFGLRIECHMAVVESRHANFLEFEVVSRLPIDPQLVDFTRLSQAERAWLADYHRIVLRDLQPLLDEPALGWLGAVVQEFERRAARDS